jgi:hypothetical protein
MTSSDRVSVVIPAYNAERTIDETLASVRRQSHGNLEIVVVDDGSTDGTAAVADRHAAEDSRIRVLRIANRGVAGARNAGIAASTAPFVAPVDADDLWHPEKIARQLAAIRQDDETGFVYTFYRLMDAEGRVLHSLGHVCEGRVFLRALLHNFVGNGSSLLVRRAALEEVGGYETDLRRRGAQGCEDFLLQVLIARRWKVACVPEYLTGYRYGSGSMSTDWDRMALSHRVMLDHVARRHPETPPGVLAASEALARASLAVRRLHRLRPAAAAAELWRALRLDAGAGARVALGYGAHTARGIVSRRLARLRPPAPGQARNFHDFAPTEAPHRPKPPFLAGRLAALAPREEAFFAAGGAAERARLSRPLPPRQRALT